MFLFDEFHPIADDLHKKLFVLGDFIGTINELQKNGFPYYLVLSGLPKLSLNVKNARSYSERMFKTITLKNLQNDESVLAISKPLRNSSYNFSKDLINTIIKDAGRYPYFIQFYCKEIIDNLSKKRINLKDYKSIRPIIFRQLDLGFFDTWIDKLTDMEKKLLITMTKMNKEDMLFADISTKSKTKKSSLSKYLASLEKKGLVHNHRYGMYRFSLPMLRDYIKRRY